MYLMRCETTTQCAVTLSNAHTGRQLWEADCVCLTPLESNGNRLNGVRFKKPLSIRKLSFDMKFVLWTLCQQSPGLRSGHRDKRCVCYKISQNILSVSKPAAIAVEFFSNGLRTGWECKQNFTQASVSDEKLSV